MIENDTKLENVVKICKALSDPTRLKIFLFLTKRSLCVNAIVNFLNISQPAVSQHLRVLREAGLVRADKRGYWMHYSANLQKLRDFFGILLEIAEEDTSPTESIQVKK
ncbi:winged helix-turn-helix transcriptional regulator [Candidatus Aerophobetes bacterium]|nr:winged helix-turn-helix transcriptional regulator [Candidatus Aerophobetes bacterium]